MRKLYLDKKTGFKNNSPAIPIIIRDSRGVLFYTTEIFLPDKPVIKFNLPAGDYFIDSGSFAQLEKPVNYTLVTLPPRERRYPKPYNFKVVYGNNPNKCSIIWGKKIIVFDLSLKDKPRFVKDFILGHEFGHQFYGTESYADLWSANYMLKMGYNPSQIGSAPITTLSDGAFERKKLMVKKLRQFR
jgi:hypothetical protein